MTGLHYGTYDYSAACGVAAPYQSLEHPVADHAKAVMQLAAAGTGVAVSDGSTNVLPVGPPAAVLDAWRLHARLVRRSLERAYYQGWDLHPGHLVTRYGATYAFYRAGMPDACDRLRGYLAHTGGGVLDEPATAQAMASLLVRGLRCGALDADEVAERAGVSVQALYELFDRRVAMTYDLVVRAGRAVLPAGETGCAIAVRDGRIAAITELDAALDAAAELRLTDEEVLLPGLVDTHVHVNEPGRTAWEGFATATAAAAAGGVTTIVDMPLNSIPPTCDVAALELKRRRALGRCAVDVGFWGGAIPGNVADLRPLHEAGVFGFKCFLLPSGVDEFPPLDAAGLRAAMREIASFDGLLVAHAEDEASIGEAPHDRAYRSFLRSRPPEAERRAIATLLDAAEETGCRVHVVHLSSAAGAADARRGARGRRGRHRRDLPALSDVRGRADPGRRDRVQVLPADPGRGEPRAALAGLAQRADRLRRLRPLAVHPRAQAAAGRGLRRGVGRHRLAAARPAGGLDGGPRAGDRAGHRRRLAGRAPRGTDRLGGQGKARRRSGRRPLRVRTG